MLVLVHYTQEFFAKDHKGCIKLRFRETFTRVFDSYSNDDLLKQFQADDHVPYFIRRLAGNTKESNLVCGNKEMLWYLPESGEPHINDVKAKYEN